MWLLYKHAARSFPTLVLTRSATLKLQYVTFINLCYIFLKTFSVSWRYNTRHLRKHQAPLPPPSDPTVICRNAQLNQKQPIRVKKGVVDQDCVSDAATYTRRNNCLSAMAMLTNLDGCKDLLGLLGAVVVIEEGSVVTLLCASIHSLIFMGGPKP